MNEELHEIRRIAIKIGEVVNEPLLMGKLIDKPLPEFIELIEALPKKLDEVQQLVDDICHNLDQLDY